MSYLTSENGTMVNMIKQKFEQNLSTKTSIENNTKDNHDNEDNDQKEQLRRSLSASPVKIKKNLKLNVTRQLSNPGKNIKRTPAFRGDKLTKIRNLHSPSKEKVFSIVNQNVKIFEEKPEYGKLGKVKKKSIEDDDDDDDDDDAQDKDFDVVDYGDKNKYEYKSIKNSNRPPLTKEKKITNENSVKTTVISRQKNISPIYNLDYDFGQASKRLNTTNDHVVSFNNLQKKNPTQFDKFIMNGAEYTKVIKSKTVNDKSIKFNDFTQDNDGDNTMIDIREELSRRKSTKLEKDEYNNNSCEATVIIPAASFSKSDDESTDELTNRLKAALKAPLPSGPPPKKPPRTFAHCPVSRRYNLDAEENVKSLWTRDRLNSCGKNTGLDVTGSSKSVRNYEVIPGDEDSSEADNGNGNDDDNDDDDDDVVVSGSSKDRVRIGEKETGLSSAHNVQNLNSALPSKNSSALNDIKEHSPTASTSSVKCRTVRDSKKMLEKLETVLIQHQKALGPKVIVPRKEKFELDMHFNNNISINNKKNQNDLNNIENTDKNKFFNRLSCTLDDPKKGNNESKNSESKTRKHSTFDCLPYLNCASPMMYEQPNFKTYFTESSSVSLNGLKSKSDDVLNNSISNILTSNNDFYDQQLSPAAKRLSTELTTFLDGKRRQSNSSAKNEERIYAEPFSFDQKSGTDIMELSKLSPEEHNYLSHNWHQCDNGFISNQKRQNTSDESLSFPPREKKREPELHYMCTPIDPLLLENNNNTSKTKELDKLSQDINFHTFLNKSNSLSRSFLDGPSQIKVEQLLNQAFRQSTMAGVEISTDSNTSSDTDSIASTPSSANDELSSFNEKLRLFKHRENSTSKTNKEELHRSLTEKRKHYVRRVSIKYSEKHETSLRDRHDKLFDVCLLVELNLCTREPYIKDKYPIYAKTPAWIENFCFPDAQDWPSSDLNQNQFYSLFLMNDKGDCRYGYCCRVKPEGGPILPLAYCMITKFRASGFYHKVLLELESRHGLPDKRRRKFIEDLYNSPMPKPGNCIKLTTDKIEILTVSSHNNNFMSNDNDICSTASETNGTNDVILNNEHRSVKVEPGSPEKIIVRSGDPRLEEKDMSQLFDAVSNKVLIFLFGTLLLERRVVLVCEKLSKLSSCVEALQSLLYPFNWPHTFIPVLPDIPELSEILQAPLPFVIGILKSKNGVNTQVDSVQDGIVIDLDTSKVLCAVGDESTILPSRLQKGIRCALQLVSSNVRPGDGIRNYLVSEAFLRLFKESFVKASPSKTYRYFLEWFVETTMFNTFVTDYIAHIEGTTVHDYYNIKLFIQRVAEYRKSAETNSQSKKFLSKKKTFGDRLKDLTNFYT
ncbi:Similar to DENND2B: DENN domain-containing protein 2B (Homo sapiens) [Cotesia congregata]|uniref:Similar to DENND2B: DENN domain-containing protein 2B (Homo sapiens) n=1 Tax=Cotesia congregata TaxID=51543 RepID=A0A8J2HI44_COTCN|nr:Similar to DENND2B: DENN domain-containing protein 2B (Homo sapiens) [Cotesia congregata]